MKIDNISMHSFVTKQCAPQFSDYLFDFWRIDLWRNIDNMSKKQPLFRDFNGKINAVFSKYGQRCN